jgi:hypothetical protein
MKIEFVLYRYLNGGNVMINQNGVSSYTVFDSFEAARGGALAALAAWGGAVVTVDVYDTLAQFDAFLGI